MNRTCMVLVLVSLGCLSVSRAEAVNLLIDINADGTNRNATTSHFEAAMGLSAGALSGDSIIYFPNNNPPSGAYSQTQSGVTVAFNNITGDADAWFDASNYLLEDGLYVRGTTGDPSAQVTLSGLSLQPNWNYDLYLFAGRSQGHETTFTFDGNNLLDPSLGSSIHTDPPVISGDNTLGTALYTFQTGDSVSGQLVFNIAGLQNVDGNQDAVFSGFALIDNGAVPPVPEPANAALLMLFGLMATRLMRRKQARQS